MYFLLSVFSAAGGSDYQDKSFSSFFLKEEVMNEASSEQLKTLFLTCFHCGHHSEASDRDRSRSRRNWPDGPAGMVEDKTEEVSVHHIIM